MIGIDLKKIISILGVVAVVAPFFISPEPASAYINSANSPADVVIGQADMTSDLQNRDGSDNAYSNTLATPMGMATDGTKLIVSEFNNNRVLIFNTVPTSVNASADVVIGQADMTSNDANRGGAVADNTLNRPTDVHYDGNKLYICDSLNSRILIYNSIPTSNNASADIVVGQANMTSGDKDQGVVQPTAAANGFDWPRSVHSDGTKLYVADPGNHRVVIFNTIPTANDASANVVIGQPNLTSYNQNQNLGSAAANTLSQTYGVNTAGTKLIIADYGNYRVLIYNTIPTANDTSADVVIGQPDMDSNDANQGGLAGANTLFVPHGTYTDGTRLWIDDQGNNRVLLFNSIPTTSNASADAVIGQQSMTVGLADQGGTVAVNTIQSSRGILMIGSKLIVADSGNRRLLVYDVSPGITVSDTPGIGPISINSAAASTNSRSITLTFNADGAKEMKISNDPNFLGASWETYARTKVWDLSSGNSVKTVYVQFRDYANYESARYSDDIELPTLAGTGSSVAIFLTIASLLLAAGVSLMMLGKTRTISTRRNFPS